MVALFGIASGCVEPIEIETGTYENALVIEGTITNELGFQEVLLSRTFRLEESGPSKESNAQVRVVSSVNTYEFEEAEPGKYISVEPFRAQPGVAYTLEVTTANGDTYTSEPEELPQSAEIGALYAGKTIFEDETGIAILVDVAGSEGTSGYYHYEFVETYKIVSPYHVEQDVLVVDGEFVEIPKTREETICYVTEASNNVLLANTNSQAGNDLDAYLIKFMNKESYRTAHRYSILVRQYSISGEAYSYYETLKDFSESESLFSQNQLGLINGNISSVNDPDEPVIGMFSVSGVSSKRIFFSFEDYYTPGDFLPNAHVECEVLFPPAGTVAQREWIGEQLEMGSIKYFGFEMGSGYRFAKTGCIDCTVFGTNVAPEFWEE